MILIILLSSLFDRVWWVINMHLLQLKRRQSHLLFESFCKPRSPQALQLTANLQFRRFFRIFCRTFIPYFCIFYSVNGYLWLSTKYIGTNVRLLIVFHCCWICIVYLPVPLCYLQWRFCGGRGSTPPLWKVCPLCPPVILYSTTYNVGQRYWTTLK